MTNHHDRKRRLINRLQRWFANPVTRRLPTQVLLETTGRTSGQPRQTPVGGRLVDRRFWLVSEHGEASNYVRNIMADNAVRIRIRGHWYAGTAHLLPDDDARARLKQLPRYNSAMVAALGTNPLTLRIDLAD